MKMDNRVTYKKWFDYCIKFPNRMAVGHGPLNFNDAIKWMTETYGWSAEMRQWASIMSWVGTSQMLHQQSGGTMTLATGILEQHPDICNMNWSWTNGYDDLRIYLASDRELNFFQLKWPNEHP